MVWRYHPDTREFEIFAEGGGNVFGLGIRCRRATVLRPQRRRHTRFSLRAKRLLPQARRKPGQVRPAGQPVLVPGELPMMPGSNIPRFSHNVISINGGAMPDDWQGKLLGADPLHRHLV